MAISIRLNDDDANLIKKYAALHNMTVSELVRKSVIERIEDELDLAAYEKTMADYKKNPVTYSMEEIEKDLGLI